MKKRMVFSWLRKMGQKLGKPDIPEKFLAPQGSVGLEASEVRKLRKLVIKGKLAPFYPGVDEGLHSREHDECPICFLHYREMNSSRCCGQRICSECFVQIRAASGGSFLGCVCPFCKSPGYWVEKCGPKSQAQIEQEELEEQRLLEHRIRQQHESLHLRYDPGQQDEGPEIVASDEMAQPAQQSQQQQQEQAPAILVSDNNPQAGNPVREQTHGETEEQQGPPVADSDAGCQTEGQQTEEGEEGANASRTIAQEYQEEYAALSNRPFRALSNDEMNRCQEYLGVFPEDLGLRLDEFNELLLEQALISSMLEDNHGSQGSQAMPETSQDTTVNTSTIHHAESAFTQTETISEGPSNPQEDTAQVQSPFLEDPPMLPSNWEANSLSQETASPRSDQAVCRLEFPQETSEENIVELSICSSEAATVPSFPEVGANCDEATTSLEPQEEEEFGSVDECGVESEVAGDKEDSNKGTDNDSDNDTDTDNGDGTGSGDDGGNDSPFGVIRRDVRRRVSCPGCLGMFEAGLVSRSEMGDQGDGEGSRLLDNGIEPHSLRRVSMPNRSTNGGNNGGEFPGVWAALIATLALEGEVNPEFRNPQVGMVFAVFDAPDPDMGGSSTTGEDGVSGSNAVLPTDLEIQQRFKITEGEQESQGPKKNTMAVQNPDGGIMLVSVPAEKAPADCGKEGDGGSGSGAALSADAAFLARMAEIDSEVTNAVARGDQEFVEVNTEHHEMVTSTGGGGGGAQENWEL